MVSVRAEEADHFYEEDEDPGEVFAAFDAAPKSRTAPPTNRSGTSARLRLEIAKVLRRLASAIEPSPVGTPSPRR
jgi:hypothetical protein